MKNEIIEIDINELQKTAEEINKNTLKELKKNKELKEFTTDIFKYFIVKFEEITADLMDIIENENINLNDPKQTAKIGIISRIESDLITPYYFNIEPQKKIDKELKKYYTKAKKEIEEPPSPTAEA